MRLFQSERIAGLMDRMGHKDGEVIQHSMVTKSIERAQKKVEENNFGIRKRLLEYDDVMNIQREAIYKKRYNALSGERLSIDIFNMFQGTVEILVSQHHGAGQYEAFRLASITELGIEPDITEADFGKMDTNSLINEFGNQVFEHYQRKGERIAEQLIPVILDVKAREGDRYKRIAVPFTDGRTKVLPIAADMDDAIASNGKTIMRDIEKTLTLAIIDDEWKEHLRAMDDLKDSVQGASFEQKDPLVIYKMEAFNLFEELVNRINHQVTGYLLSGMIVQQGPPQQAQQAPRPPKLQLSREEDQPELTETAQQMEAAARGVNQPQRQASAPVRVQDRVGRNDACPCGSGKKYKHCHGK
jgi:preprotein translocase subunit SecA